MRGAEGGREQADPADRAPDPDAAERAGPTPPPPSGTAAPAADAVVTIRDAEAGDLEAIVEMLADDPLGRTRERPGRPLPRGYLDAFEAIRADPGNRVVVACVDGRVVGTLQLTFTPTLSHQGATRATIEGVRAAASVRGRGIGSALVGWAVGEARARGCRLVQLTSDASRTDAQRFYRRLGFRATHVGMKLHLLGDAGPPPQGPAAAARPLAGREPRRDRSGEGDGAARPEGPDAPSPGDAS